MPVNGIEPTRQRFATAQLFGVRPHNRLIEGNDPTVVYGVVDIVDDVQPLTVRLAHGLVVLDIDRLETVLDQVGGVARTVDADPRILGVRSQAIGAAVDPEQDLVVVVADDTVQAIQFLGQTVGFRHHDEVVVRLSAVERIGKNLGNGASDGDKEAVARLKSPLVVERLEVVDVDEEQDVLRRVARDAPDPLGRQFGKVVVVIEPGQLILFRALFERLGLARLDQPPVIDRETDGGQRDEEGDVVDRVARDDLVHHAADLDLLILERQPLLEGEQDPVESVETGPEDQNRHVRTVDQEAADVDDHRQKADDLFPAPEIAVRNEDAEREADQSEARDRDVFEDDDPLALEVVEAGVGHDRRADDEQENVDRDQHGVHDPRHNGGNRVAGLGETLQFQNRRIEHTGGADHDQRDELPSREPFAPLIEQAEEHQPQPDQEEQPVFRRVLDEQFEQIPALLIFREDLGVRLPDQHPQFEQNDDEPHIAAAADVRVVQVVVLVLGQLFKTENPDKKLPGPL